MKEFTIDWTFGGSTLVEAESEEQARTIFREEMDHVAICYEAIHFDPYLDIFTVREE